jgi:hypothetical protein
MPNKWSARQEYRPGSAWRLTIHVLAGLAGVVTAFGANLLSAWLQIRGNTATIMQKPSFWLAVGGIASITTITIAIFVYALRREPSKVKAVKQRVTFIYSLVLADSQLNPRNGVSAEGRINVENRPASGSLKGQVSG